MCFELNIFCLYKKHVEVKCDQHVFVFLQLAMASMASMDTGVDGQPPDMKEAQGKFKVGNPVLSEKYIFEKSGNYGLKDGDKP